MLIIYNIIYVFLFLCYLPFLIIKGKYHRGFLMRLGFFPQSAVNKIKGQKLIWLHTVSVGETQATASLIKQLRQQYPGFRLVISTVTTTGNKIAQGMVDSQDAVIFAPLDIGFVVGKVVDLIEPQLFIVAETEIWPNLIFRLTSKGIPVVLVNGRVSCGSFKGYKIIRPFLKGVLEKFNLFCMQTKEDAQRIIELGAPDAKVKITGNMKFDIQKPVTSNQKPDLRLSEEEKLLIAGSTHGGEEKIVLQVYKELIKKYPTLRLLIAPRHMERVKEIEKLISNFKFASRRISRINLNQQSAKKEQRPILILDTIGQLKSLYAVADIVFIGGSLIPRGGQNPIEPAVFSKPILFGPYMSNFAYVAEALLNKRAAMPVKDAQQLQNSCLRLLNEPKFRQELGERANAVIEENKNATLRNIELIKGIFTPN